jgi:hypothetical protein
MFLLGCELISVLIDRDKKRSEALNITLPSYAVRIEGRSGHACCDLFALNNT